LSRAGIRDSGFGIRKSTHPRGFEASPESQFLLQRPNPLLQISNPKSQIPALK
jgi:hypothetical protein